VTSEMFDTGGCRIRGDRRRAAVAGVDHRWRAALEADRVRLREGLGLQFQASMLSIGLIVILITLPWLTDGPFDPLDVVVVAVMGLVCFTPLGSLPASRAKPLKGSATAADRRHPRPGAASAQRRTRVRPDPVPRRAQRLPSVTRRPVS